MGQTRSEQIAQVNGIELCYETFGSPEDPALLLIMGLGGQMIWWDDELCGQLAAAGFHVIRFDNRDCGRSTILAHAGVPKNSALRRRDPSAAAYSLDDMAADAVGLLDLLGITAAHVVGVSMGGMIAQILALRHPRRVLSLCSISSTTGDPSVGKMRWRLYPVFLRPLPRDRARYVQAFIRLAKKVGSPGKYAPDDAQVRDLAERSFERGFHPDGTRRQFAAAITAPNRTPLLRQLRVPAVVIHGKADGLIRPSGGEATAEAIPDARLVLIKGMAHDLPRQIWPQLISEISENAARARGAVTAVQG
jgi:pimeloyl-ACP methyl ester carboxylesterase